MYDYESRKSMKNIYDLISGVKWNEKIKNEPFPPKVEVFLSSA